MKTLTNLEKAELRVGPKVDFTTGQVVNHHLDLLRRSSQLQPRSLDSSWVAEVHERAEEASRPLREAAEKESARREAMEKAMADIHLWVARASKVASDWLSHHATGKMRDAMARPAAFWWVPHEFALRRTIARDQSVGPEVKTWFYRQDKTTIPVPQFVKDANEQARLDLVQGRMPRGDRHAVVANHVIEDMWIGAFRVGADPAAVERAQHALVEAGGDYGRKAVSRAEFQSWLRGWVAQNTDLSLQSYVDATQPTASYRPDSGGSAATSGYFGESYIGGGPAYPSGAHTGPSMGATGSNSSDNDQKMIWIALAAVAALVLMQGAK